MKIDHVALLVSDLEGARKFFTDYFHATSNEMYHNPRTGLQTYFLSFDSGARLEIMTRPEIQPSDAVSCMAGYVHLAFSVGSKAKVDDLTATLRADGYEVLSGPRTTGDGYYESCVKGFEGNLIEITV